jgi:chromosome segregation ATPase
MTSQDWTAREDELEAELERVKASAAVGDRLLESTRAQLEEAKTANSRMAGYLSKRDAECLGLRSDLRSLERLYARAIDAQVQAERARDDARAETQRLLEENRELRLRRALDVETSATPASWSLENPARGQCAVTALVVQDEMGRERGVVNGESHYWNPTARSLIGRSNSMPGRYVRKAPW